MWHRLTVSILLKSVIALMAIGIVGALSFIAWTSWDRLRDAGRVSAVADASASAFKAMHNLGTDRSATVRTLNGDAPVAAEIEKFLHRVREAEMPAMRSAADLLPSTEFS